MAIIGTHDSRADTSSAVTATLMTFLPASFCLQALVVESIQKQNAPSQAPWRCRAGRGEAGPAEDRRVTPAANPPYGVVG
jgi:hypothetical protein